MTAERELSAERLEVLLLACKQSDRAAEARKILANEPVCDADRFGQVKAHPAVDIERKASHECVALLTTIIGKMAAESVTEPAKDDFFDE